MTDTPANDLGAAVSEALARNGQAQLAAWDELGDQMGEPAVSAYAADLARHQARQDAGVQFAEAMDDAFARSRAARAALLNFTSTDQENPS